MLEGHFGGWAAVRQDCYVVEAVELILDSLGNHLFVVNCCMQWKLASGVLTLIIPAKVTCHRR